MGNNQRRSSLDVSTMIYGKVPPQAKDVEGAILGIIMLEKNAFDITAEILKPESFYIDANQKIYKTMAALSRKGVQIDILTVVEELKTLDQLELCGGPFYITKLTNEVVGSANLETYCLIVKQKFLQRELIRMCGTTIQQAYEDSTDVFDLIDQHEREFTGLTVGNFQHKAIELSDAVMATFKRIEELRVRDNKITGVSSGFLAIDRITHGWQPADLIILAARPAVGKTAFALKLARNAALDPFKRISVAMFSLEMSTEQLTQRMISAESGIWLDLIRNGQLTDEHMKILYARAGQTLANAKIFIDDTAALNIYELRTRARSLARKVGDLGLIIIDYLQLMSGSGGKHSNREQEISQISRELKILAKELGVPVIALSQLSRAVETRKNEIKMPQLSDLRESGAIEQDADMVMFMYRPEYYDINSNENGESTKGETDIRIAKHRNGSLETIKLQADLACQNFTPWNGALAVAQQTSDNRWKPMLFTETDDK